MRITWLGLKGGGETRITWLGVKGGGETRITTLTSELLA
jgi:hypothetical protein